MLDNERGVANAAPLFCCFLVWGSSVGIMINDLQWKSIRGKLYRSEYCCIEYELLEYRKRDVVLNCCLNY